MNEPLLKLILPIRVRCTVCGTSAVKKANAMCLATELSYMREHGTDIGVGIRKNNCLNCGGETQTVGHHLHLQLAEPDSDIVFGYEDPSQVWKLKFLRLHVDSQVYNHDNEHAIAAATFLIAGIQDLDFSQSATYLAVIRQPHGESFSFTESPLEVELPAELRGRLNHQHFQRATEDYYRHHIGPEGVGIRMPLDAPVTISFEGYEKDSIGYSFVLDASLGTANAW